MRPTSAGPTCACVRPAFGAAEPAGPPAGRARRLRAPPATTPSSTSRSAPCSTRRRGCWRRRSPGCAGCASASSSRPAPASIRRRSGRSRRTCCIVEYVPHALFLRHCDVVVSHAGAGIMFGALAHGLPQLLLPQGADQSPTPTPVVEAGVAAGAAARRGRRAEEAAWPSAACWCRRRSAATRLACAARWPRCPAPGEVLRRPPGRRRRGGRERAASGQPRRRTAAAIWVDDLRQDRAASWRS